MGPCSGRCYCLILVRSVLWAPIWSLIYGWYALESRLESRLGAHKGPWHNRKTRCLNSTQADFMFWWRPSKYSLSGELCSVHTSGPEWSFNDALHEWVKASLITIIIIVIIIIVGAVTWTFDFPVLVCSRAQHHGGQARVSYDGTYHPQPSPRSPSGVYLGLELGGEYMAEGGHGLYDHAFEGCGGLSGMQRPVRRCS